MYYIYHILGKKVGLTTNIEMRLTEQGCREGDYEVIDEFEDLNEALNAEQEYTLAFGYKKTPKWHPDLDKTQMKFKLGKGVSVTFAKTPKDYVDFFKAEVVNFGDRYIFRGDEVPMLEDLAKEGTQYGGWFFYQNALRNLREDLDELPIPGSLEAHILEIEEEEREERMKIIGQNGNDGLHYDGITEFGASRSGLPERQFNECANLDVESTKATLDEVFELQKSLQQKFPETTEIGDQTIADTAVAAQRNLHAFLDEVMEYMDALGGMSDIKNGGWKYWKKDYQKAKKIKISDLSPEDLKELKFEYVDMFHFFINWGLMIGMTGTELIDMYVAKNKENFDRQKRGY